MSFKPSSKQQKSPLMANDSKDLLETLQKKYLNFIKIYEKMNDYEKKLNTYSRREYDSIKEDVHNNIQQVPKLLNEIFNIINNIENNDNNDNRVKDQIRIVNEKLKPKQNEIQTLIRKICDKEAIVLKKLSILNPEEIENSRREYDHFNTNDSNTNLPIEESKRQSNFGFRESKLIIRDVLDQNEYLNMRTKELEDIKKVAHQIKDISESMKVELNDQGKKVEQIDNNIEEVKSNCIKAELEIQEADKISKSSAKNYYCLVLFILLLLLGILLTFLFLFIF